MSRIVHRLPTVGASIFKVTKTTSGRIDKSWLYRYAVAGRKRQMGLGSLSDVKLSAARQRAAERREQRLEGIDPIEARDRARHKSEASGMKISPGVRYVLRHEAQ
jgi:hypothetical protein